MFYPEHNFNRLIYFTQREFLIYSIVQCHLPNETGKIFYYNGVIMSAMASQITNLTIVYSTVYSGADQRKHQSSASLAFVRGIHRWPVNSPHKGPVTRKKFTLDDVILFQNHPNCIRASHTVHVVSSESHQNSSFPFVVLYSILWIIERWHVGNQP